MIGLSNENTPKSSSSWSRNGKAKCWLDKYPPNPIGSSTVRGWGEIAIKEGGG